MTTLREAAQQALDILYSEFTTVDGEFCRWCDGRLNAKHNCNLEQAITALKAALAETVQEPVQEPEPVGWFEGPFGEFRANPLHRIAWPAQTVAWSIPLYLATPQRKLTEDEIDELAMDEDGLPNSHLEFARAIERAHGIWGDK